MQDLLTSLNPKQAEAVSLPQSHALILAGAGSGKTRVLVHRLAWLFSEEGLSPNRVLAVTFTNKAAGEMRARTEELLGINTRGMWIGTFHGLAHRLLRIHYQELGLPETFQVLDSDDQLRLIRRLLKSMNLDEKYFPAKQVQGFINARKDEGVRASEVKFGHDRNTETFAKVYSAYEVTCKQGGLVDFAELLLSAYDLLRNNPQVLLHYQERFKHILVDEFQDTNHIQYSWLKLLAGQSGFIMAVGDDDQSIYGWRGAKVENMQLFTQEFPNVHMVRLEQNYRSTKNILAAANGVIEHNQGRLGKDLWTDGEDGDRVSVYAAFNELDEARFIVSRIQTSVDQYQISRKDCAILYRSNAQSRVLEEALIQAGMPYRVYGGLRFFERAEIKDSLAYLRLVNNPDDSAAFERIVNVPTRGIGERSLDMIRQTARANETSMWVAAQTVCKDNMLSARAVNAIQNFMLLISDIGDGAEGLPLYEQVDHAIQHSGLIPQYQKEPGEKGQARIDNLAELVTAARQFDPVVVPEESTTPLASFLAHAVLESGEGQADKYEDSVQLMTMHAAKGLEFPVVFIAGFEDQLFPSRFNQDDPTKIQEERRLCYVAMTRAMKKLFITHAEYRRLFGESKPHNVSRFLREIPEDTLEEVRMRANVSRPVVNQPGSRAQIRTTTSGHLETNQGKTYRVGDQVNHQKFGDGTVINYEGAGDMARLQVRFADTGTKWLVAAYANLEKV